MVHFFVPICRYIVSTVGGCISVNIILTPYLDHDMILRMYAYTVCRHWQSSWSLWTGRYHRKQSKLWTYWTNGVRWMLMMLLNCCRRRSSTRLYASTPWRAYNRLMMRSDNVHNIVRCYLYLWGYVFAWVCWWVGLSVSRIETDNQVDFGEIWMWYVFAWVCWWVGLSVSRITEEVTAEFPWNFWKP